MQRRSQRQNRRDEDHRLSSAVDHEIGMGTIGALLNLSSLGAKFCIDKRMIAVFDGKTLRQSVRAIGEIEPFFGKREQVALIRLAFGAVCQLDRLCGVVSIIVFFGHG
jgi:hypothetical protein